MQRELYLTKMGDGGLGGSANHGKSPPSDPFDSTAHNVGTDGAADTAYRRWRDAVKKHMAAGMTASKAHDAARLEMSAQDWGLIKSLTASDVHVISAVNNPTTLDHSPGRSPLMPPSHDANSRTARGPYSSFHAQRPY
jgi:hypothetical protein